MMQAVQYDHHVKTAKKFVASLIGRYDRQDHTALIEPYEKIVAEFNFGFLYSNIEGLKNRAVQQWVAIIEAGLKLPDDVALSVWIAHVKTASLGFNTEEDLANRFRRALKGKRLALAAAAAPKPEPFLYDGTPVVRPHRVFHVDNDAGRPPVGTNYGRAKHEHLSRYSKKELNDDVADLRKRLMSVASWYDRHEGSRYDMIGYIDSMTRAAEAHLENKRTYLKKINAQLRDMNRQMLEENEIDLQQREQLVDRKQAVTRSGYMLKDAAEAHHAARADIYAYCGQSMETFRTWAQMKADKRQYAKLKVSIVDADKLLGLSEADYRVWKGINDRLIGGEVGGVEAAPDEMVMGNLQDAANVVERNKRQAKANAKADGEYRRTKPQARPKKDVAFEPSNEKGSRYRALVQTTEKAKKAS